MPQGKPVPPMVVEEALASGDARFIELLRSCRDPKGLARIVERWKKDHRPWAHQQILRYLELPMNAPAHEVVVKRLFKHAEAQKDDEVMGAFMAAFDRLARRRRIRERFYDWQTGQVQEWWILRSPHYNQLTQKAPNHSPFWISEAEWEDYIQRRGLRLFSYHTRYYLRRRAWRYFRRMGFQQPGKYPAAVAAALGRYREEDLSEGQAILDSWGLMHACFGASEGVKFSVRHADLVESRRLEEMVAPAFEKLWEEPASAPILLELAIAAPARPIRMWSATLVRRHHLSNLAQIGVERLLAVLNHSDPDVQALGADLIENAQSLDKLDLSIWLKLLSTTNVTALAAIAHAMQKHVRPERVSLEQAIALACARPAPVARLGLEILQTKPIATESERDLVARLAAAQSEGLGREIAAWALAILGSGEFYNVDRVSRFFDSLLTTVREGAWEWFTPAAAGWNDPALWSRLSETPYEDVRLRLVGGLENRKSNIGSAGDLAPLWCSVLLGIHRGGRTKLIALGQVSDALARQPERAASLLPVLAVAVRSVRLPEARRGLAAVVQVLERRPELSSLVREHFPELHIEEATP